MYLHYHAINDMLQQKLYEAPTQRPPVDDGESSFLPPVITPEHRPFPIACSSFRLPSYLKRELDFYLLAGFLACSSAVVCDTCSVPTPRVLPRIAHSSIGGN
ncbi:hypothetical protein TNIN_426071 [Trichonephila inaurata madagascariensis]|uniref:Uncharacterized protein n=1 Tax=Trichonephila inaurata madagascariensis TaxID=2747483 RepID=A0A8X6I2H6_9ARAC|nr:hypothetical protein TNIN_426071 [Trichonephila inaurata madagascariensis]